GENIRPRGQDMARGCETLPVGRRLDPRDIALAAASGAGTLTVRRRLGVRLFSTGAELAALGTALAPGAIWDVNRAMLAALIAGPAVDLADGGCLPDAPAAVAAALIEAACDVDLVVTSGGASVGEEDHLADAILRAGGEILLRKVAMKPGKPLTLARLGPALVLALPGNPVAAFVGWHVFGRRLVAALTGADHQPRRMLARLADGAIRRPGRCEFRPARVAGVGADGLPRLTLAPAEFSARVAALAHADGLALIPAETDRLAPGDMVEFEPLGSWR
ncbi:MAG: molybdopterin molybdotransferase MoeA, partial [Thermohalobaculum sp.]|nr:molybdopterin molybdotransferase MoeA [Thermohalobaculum sp.]